MWSVQFYWQMSEVVYLELCWINCKTKKLLMFNTLQKRMHLNLLALHTGFHQLISRKLIHQFWWMPILTLQLVLLELGIVAPVLVRFGEFILNDVCVIVISLSSFPFNNQVQCLNWLAFVLILLGCLLYQLYFYLMEQKNFLCW